MKTAKWWFDLHNPKHVIMSMALIIICNVAIWLSFQPDTGIIYSSRKPIVIFEVLPHQDSIKLSEDYGLTVTFEKTRADCENGRLVRHMWEVQNGWTYKTEEIDTIVSEPGQGKISSKITTKPFFKKDLDLMKPGLWSIKTKISYDCPIGAGEFLSRDVSFSTPIFEVKGG